MFGRIFYFISSLFMLIGIFIFISPSLMSPDLIYPIRIDSTYMTYHAGIIENNADSLLLNPTEFLPAQEYAVPELFPAYSLIRQFAFACLLPATHWLIL